MSATHTPGPWHVQHGVGVYAATGDLVASVHTPITVDGNSKDARLIAAAPELLEALKDCRRALELAEASGELAVVDAAIAKATGEQA